MPIPAEHTHWVIVFSIVDAKGSTSRLELNYLEDHQANQPGSFGQAEGLQNFIDALARIIDANIRGAITKVVVKNPPMQLPNDIKKIPFTDSDVEEGTTIIMRGSNVSSKVRVATCIVENEQEFVFGVDGVSDTNQRALGNIFDELGLQSTLEFRSWFCTYRSEILQDIKSIEKSFLPRKR